MRGMKDVSLSGGYGNICSLGTLAMRRKSGPPLLQVATSSQELTSDPMGKSAILPEARPPPTWECAPCPRQGSGVQSTESDCGDTKEPALMKKASPV